MNTANAAPGPLSSATERMVPDLPRPAAMPGDLDSSERVLALDKEIRATPRALCAERAVLLTRYFREEAKWAEPMGDSCTMIVKKAAALIYYFRKSWCDATIVRRVMRRRGAVAGCLHRASHAARR